MKEGRKEGHQTDSTLSQAMPHHKLTPGGEFTVIHKFTVHFKVVVKDATQRLNSRKGFKKGIQRR